MPFWYPGLKEPGHANLLREAQWNQRYSCAQSQSQQDNTQIPRLPEGINYPLVLRVCSLYLSALGAAVPVQANVDLAIATAAGVRGIIMHPRDL